MNAAYTPTADVGMGMTGMGYDPSLYETADYMFPQAQDAVGTSGGDPSIYSAPDYYGPTAQDVGGAEYDEGAAYTGGTQSYYERGAPPGVPPSTAETFRNAVSEAPGRWWQNVAGTPTAAVNYTAEHPFRSAFNTAMLGALAYRLSQGQPSAQTQAAPNFTWPQVPAPPAAPPLPPPGPPRSPLVGSNVSRRGRGGMNIT